MNKFNLNLCPLLEGSKRLQIGVVPHGALPINKGEVLYECEKKFFTISLYPKLPNHSYCKETMGRTITSPRRDYKL